MIKPPKNQELFNLYESLKYQFPFNGLMMNE